MDLTRLINYRGCEFNFIESPEGVDVIAGTTVEEVLWGDVEVAGYTEKRALEDGFDGADVFLGRRRVTLRGRVYGLTRSELYDRLRDMRYACDPRLSYEESPHERGFQPLYFSEATGLSDFPDGALELMVKARAITGVRSRIVREGQGGEDTDPLAVPYEVTFECIDPRSYLAERSISYLTGAEGTIVGADNRGGYPARVNIILVCDADADDDRTFAFDGPNGSFDISVPMSNDPSIIRFDGERKDITLQQLDAEVRRLDLVSPDLVWPLLPNGQSDISWTFTNDDDGSDATLGNGSAVWWREAFA